MEEKNIKTEKTPKKKINKKEVWRAAAFTIFSISAGIIEFISFTLFTLLPGYTNEQWYWLAATGSLTLSVLWNFTINRKITFQSASNVPIAMLKTLAYYAVFGPLSIVLAQMYLIDTLGWNEFIVKGVVMLVNFSTEFLYQRFVVFGKTIDTKPIKHKKKQKEENEIAE